MEIIGKKICETRKFKGLSQEELADLSKVNLRTIQRIENSKNIPRGKTLNLICKVLDIEIKELQNINKDLSNKSFLTLMINIIFLFLLNLLLMFIFGYLTLDSEANLNSRIGGLLLSFFIPIFIVYLTPKMKDIERVLKFGVGYFSYIIMLLFVKGIIIGFQTGVRTGLFLCLVISIGVLFYGNALINRNVN